MTKINAVYSFIKDTSKAESTKYNLCGQIGQANVNITDKAYLIPDSNNAPKRPDFIFRDSSHQYIGGAFLKDTNNHYYIGNNKDAKNDLYIYKISEDTTKVDVAILKDSFFKYRHCVWKLLNDANFKDQLNSIIYELREGH